ncbi:MAG: lipid-A-disaccharide synthase [Parvularculaceae bacterium]|nr:lipid-A-disaccharide synthase [Parvularculaceae bacterium]
MSAAGPKIMLVAVEPSGDALGAALMPALRAALPGVAFTGCGGPLMAAQGLENLFAIDRFAVIGPVEAFSVWREAEKRGLELAAHAAREGVDAAILIDAWSFSKLAAERLRRFAPQTRLFKFVAPQVWASRSWRTRRVAELFEGVLCLFPFEPPYFERVGVKTAFVGNPNFQNAWANRGQGARFREKYGLGDRPLLLLAPGSRRAEIRSLMGVLEKATAMLSARLPEMAVAIPVAAAVEAEVARRTRSWTPRPLLVSPAEKTDAFAAATAAIAKSGTVTTELAINRAPMVVVYKVDPATYLWIRAVLRTPFVSILNIAAQRHVLPELLQWSCTPENVAGAALPLLVGGEARTQQLSDLPSLLASLGVDGPPAAGLAARKIREWLAAPRPRLLTAQKA